MVKNRNDNRICYLCGKLGAESKDHIPPKGLLPPGSNDYQRITVPAHRSCNSAGSVDEEYLRDLLIPAAVHLEIPGAEAPYKKVWRAWSKPHGYKRYQKFMKSAVPLVTMTMSGIYTGKATGIAPETMRIHAVVTKTIRGVIFHDASAIIEDEEITIATLDSRDVKKIKARDSKERIWASLSRDTCKHTMLADTVSIRRSYEGHGTDNGVIIEAHIAVAIWNLFVVSSLVFPLERVKNKNFEFAVKTSNLESGC